MSRTFSSGIPARLIIVAVFAVIVIPGIIFAAILMNRYAEVQRGRYQQEAIEAATTGAAVVDRHIRSWQITLQTLGTSKALRDGDLEGLYRQALEVKAFIGADIGLRDLSGQQLVNTRQSWGKELPFTPFPVDQQVIASARPHVTNVFTGAIAQRPLVAVIVPIFIDGAPRYLLHVGAETALFADVIKSMIPLGWFVAIGDRDGVYVTRSEDHDRFTGQPGVPAFLAQAVGKQGTFVGKSALGEEILVGYARSELSDWLVAANIRRSVVEQPLRSAVIALTAGGITSLFVMLIAATLLWRLIGKPLRSLTLVSARLGKFSGPIQVPTKLTEFIALRDAMSEASQKLNASSAELEAKVADRTAELAQASELVRAEAAERQRIEAMLAQAQKMEAVGNLTGGVAHDFNNLLQVVGGNLELLKKEPGLSEKAHTRIANAVAGVSRGAQLAAQLLAFGRRQALEPRVINVGRFIRGMDDLLRRTLGEEIEIETVVAGGLWHTFVDPTNVENAILNLAINARDAMDGAGRLTIEAGNSYLDDDYVRWNAEAARGQYVVISVTDTGSGMPPELLAKVFEPFFSTKPVGKGTGLGLSMVYGFVKQSGGHVKIYSEVGHGTTIKLYLPRSHDTEDVIDHSDQLPVIGGTEQVLVVEDDDAVRDTVVNMLSELGYRVLQAPNAQSAMSIIESGTEIDLLFTDVIMPGPLKSAELARSAKAILPRLAVLFTSGYTENSIVHGGRLDEGVHLLSKPYTREAMARKLRYVLAAEKAPSPPNSSATSDDAASLTVLLVEDDAIIRLDAAEMIESLGHKVLEAGSGREAIALAETHTIDRLMTDIGLPDISGVDLATRLRERNADLIVVFATGRSQLDGFQMDNRTRLVSKPYGAADLAAALAAERLQT